jgi:hypothetical protein
MTLPSSSGLGRDADAIPAIVVGDPARLAIGRAGAWRERLTLYDRVDQLRQRLEHTSPPAILIETRDADGVPVPAAIRSWVARNSRVPIVVLTAGSRSAFREILDLTAAGGDVRLVLHSRGDVPSTLDRLLGAAAVPWPGAVPSLLRGVVLAAPATIQPELTLAVYHAWPDPGVQSWASAVGLTRQALDQRLAKAHVRNASVVLQYFSAAEIAIRLTRGMKLREIALAMGRQDPRSLRRRLSLLGTRPELLRDEADFRALIPKVATGIQRP